MTWNKLDDKLHMHQKVRAAWQRDPAAVGLWTMCLSYCGDYLTDGFVPDWYVATLISGRRRFRLADILIDVGLWEPAQSSGEKGWLFHDYLDHNPSREEVLADREWERLRKREQRKKAKEAARAEQMSQWDTQGDSQWESGLPDPTRPDPTRSGGPSCPGVVGESGTAHAREAESPKTDNGFNGTDLDLCWGCRRNPPLGAQAKGPDDAALCRDCNDARYLDLKDERA